MSTIEKTLSVVESIFANVTACTEFSIPTGFIGEPCAAGVAKKALGGQGSSLLDLGNGTYKVLVHHNLWFKLETSEAA